MMTRTVEAALAERGLTLPPPFALPPGVTIPFQWVRVHGNRAFVSGHGAISDDGSAAGPFGSVPSQVSVEDAQQVACRALLAILASLARELGSLDRIAAWLTVTALVNADPGFDRLTVIANPMSQLLVDLFGPDRGAHARVSPGVAALPFDVPVVIAAELALAD